MRSSSHVRRHRAHAESAAGPFGSAETRRLKSFLGMEAIQQFVETEEDIVLGIKQAQAEFKAGLGIPHEDVVKQSRAYLDAAKARRA
jgi:predicted transcriptional regulator